MIARIGNFLFHYRNALFPAAYLLLFAKRSLLTPSVLPAALAGFGVALLGQGLRAVTIGLDYIVRGGRHRQVYADRLVTGGVFAHCRNPLYVGNYLILVGLGIASNSVLFLVAALPLFAFAYWAIIVAEEAYLRRHFGGEFEAYCARVDRLMPRFTGFGATLHGMGYNWRRLITAEYGSAAAWLMALGLVTLQNLWLAGALARGDWTYRLIWAGIGGVALAYASARCLKKSGRLQG